ncbi:hypothetical protein C4J81_06475 [Deltaproteobacteria bacterium Smac51]|nr:hypothetical protein C4J81_06475 [Deltaproteobacteria bacterium Smac51]
MKRSISLILLICLFMLGGCASRFNRLGASYWPEDFPSDAVAAVAEHLADVMVANYPPGYTSFFLAQTENPKDELAPALEAALRSRGFALVAERDGQVLVISYVLDRADDDLWYSRLLVSDGFTMTRTWRWTGDSLLMEAATKTGRTEKTNGQS